MLDEFCSSHTAPQIGSLARLVRAVCDQELAPEKLALTHVCFDPMRLHCIEYTIARSS
jgi:hypothetical protein